ncbi:ACP S-malonyltransferase [Lysobacter korlensis]|uniref:[acyl-carrier-protein] S-malonyltransferase n=1 Tax=Lysobacter korlensis TaxID=553636 RepID=A0ABV6RMF0_9GAMM
MIVIVAPGQGSQTPGFLGPWVAEPRFRSHLERLSDAAQLDLVAHGTESDADTIRDTSVAQPLIVAAGLLTLGAILEGDREHDGHVDVAGIAGHSVGEITAAVGARVLTEHDAMVLVRERGKAMAAAASAVRTGMSAVLGADEEELLPTLDALGLSPANFNGGGQIVVAGELEALDRLKAAPPAGARVIPLQVAGAFHTRYMEPAVERLREVASGLTVANPRIELWTNRDGSAVADGAQFLELLVGQVSSPVRWDRCMESFASEGVTGIIELAPAGALVGLAKRALKGVPAVAVKTPDDLPAALKLIEDNA